MPKAARPRIGDTLAFWWDDRTIEGLIISDAPTPRTWWVLVEAANGLNGAFLVTLDQHGNPMGTPDDADMWVDNAPRGIPRTDETLPFPDQT